MEGRDWLLTVLTVSAGNSFATLLPVVKGETPDKGKVRRAYAHQAIYVLAFGTILAFGMNTPDALLAAIAIVLANIAANEWAFMVASVEEDKAAHGDPDI